MMIMPKHVTQAILHLGFSQLQSVLMRSLACQGSIKIGYRNKNNNHGAVQVQMYFMKAETFIRRMAKVHFNKLIS